jgi:hypothetical protein
MSGFPTQTASAAADCGPERKCPIRHPWKYGFHRPSSTEKFLYVLRGISTQLLLHSPPTPTKGIQSGEFPSSPRPAGELSWGRNADRKVYAGPTECQNVYFHACQLLERKKNLVEILESSSSVGRRDDDVIKVRMRHVRCLSDGRNEPAVCVRRPQLRRLSFG